MAHPTITSSSGGAGWGTSTVNATLPSGTGGVLFAVGWRTDSTTDWPDPSGWTRLTSTSGNGRRSWRWARVTTGSDAFALDRSASGGEFAWVMYRATGLANGTLADIEETAFTDFSGDGDPPSLTASWGATDNTFAAWCGRGGNDITSYPTDYTGNQTKAFNDGTFGAVAIATKQSTLATDDPGLGFSTGGATVHVGTVVFRGTTPPAGPTITDQPDNEPVVEGDPATFTVAATGTGTLTYQWQEDDGGGFSNVTNGGAYSGATTATLTIDPTTLGLDGYLYRCNVTDDNGTTASDSAELTVTAAPLEVVTDALVDEAGDPRASYTVDKVFAVRLSDNTLVHTWTNQTTSGSGVLTLSHASLTAAPHLIATWDDIDSPNNAGAKVYTPS